MLELLLAITVTVGSAAPPAPGFAPRVLRIEEQGVLVGEVWPAEGELPRNGRIENRANFSRVPEGTCIGLLRLASEWTDYRGQKVAPGIYRMTYRIQPLLKDHAGTTRYRDFAVLEKGIPSGHPRVMALVPPDEADAVLDSGGIRFGLVFEGRGTEPGL